MDSERFPDQGFVFLSLQYTSHMLYLDFSKAL